MVKRVFGMKVRERLGIDTWHPDVRFYDIFDADDELRGGFYLDLYARELWGGAWMDVCLGRRYRQDGSLQKPVAYLTCNLQRPGGRQTGPVHPQRSGHPCSTSSATAFTTC